MVKQLLFLLLLFTGPVCFGQDPEEDAIHLKSKRRDLWYADSSFHLPPQQTAGKEGQMTPTRVRDTKLLEKAAGVLGYLIGALILGALIYAFYNFLKQQNPKKTKPERSEESAPETAEELCRTDFSSRIKAAESQGDFRLAIRYRYLQLLQELAKQSLIRYEKNKTNKQYAEEIKNHKWGADFHKATRYYNFVWYGGHLPDIENYQYVAAHFQKMPPHE